MRVGTLNIQSARGGNLEGCCRGLAALNLDVAILTETKIANKVYTRRTSGYDIIASKAASPVKKGEWPWQLRRLVARAGTWRMIVPTAQT